MATQLTLYVPGPSKKQKYGAAGPCPCLTTVGLTTPSQWVSFKNPLTHTLLPPLLTRDAVCICCPLTSEGGEGLLLRVQVCLSVFSLSLPSMQQQEKPEPLSPCAHPTGPKPARGASEVDLSKATLAILQSLVHLARESGMKPPFLDQEETSRSLM